MDRRRVPVKIDSIGGGYMFEGRVSEAVSMLSRYLDKYPDAYIERQIQDYSDDYEFVVYYDRDETDAEYEHRIQQDEAYRRRRMENLVAEAKMLGVRIVSDD